MEDQQKDNRRRQSDHRDVTAQSRDRGNVNTSHVMTKLRRRMSLLFSSRSRSANTSLLVAAAAATAVGLSVPL